MHIWNGRASRSDWGYVTRTIINRVGGEAKVEEFEGYGGSLFRSRCGWWNKHLNGVHAFVCGGCGLSVDRRFNAAVNLHTRMSFG